MYRRNAKCATFLTILFWATDGSPDTLRIRIWWEADGVETPIYDNDAEPAIGAGNIVVHKDK